MNEQMPKELSKPTRVMILSVVLLLIAVTLVVKFIILPPSALSGSRSAQETLDTYLAQGMPVMVYFYSDSCSSCREMETVIDEVYPPFRATVAMIEVNVYDEKNKDLIEKTGVQITPTTLFIDKTGRRLLVPEKMSAEELRTQLSALAGDQP
jgi:thiol:disulfide interchange protein